MSEKTLTFYSGKLWHSSKPFPSGFQLPSFNEHDSLIKDWTSTAYEVVNPEVMPGIYEYDGSVYYLSQEEMPKELKDGDQITLPEGYGIEKHYQHDSGHLIRRVAITLPEPEECPKCRTKEPKNCHSMHCPMRKEPGNSAHGQHCGGLNCPAFEYACADVCMRPIIKPVSEPSESQEETDDHLKEGIEDTLYSTGKFTPELASEVTQEILRLVEKFHITRRK